MSIDSIASELGGLFVALSAVWLLSRFTNKRGPPNLPLTTATNPVIVSTAKSTVASERLQRLVESGAITQDEFAVLSSSCAQAHGDNARLSILQNGPNKIQDIKALRTQFKLGLREAKDIVDSLPQTFVCPMPRAKAVAISQQLQSTGMTTHIS